MLTRRSPGTTPRTISARPLRHIHHPSSPRQASAIWPQSLVPATEFTHLFSFVKKKKKKEKGHDFIRSAHTGETHLLYEDLEHRPAIRHVAAEARAARVRIVARDLSRLREVDAIVAYGESRAIEAGRSRATDVHHHAGWVTVRAMHNAVLVEKTQALRRPSAVSIACEPEGERRRWATKGCVSRFARPVYLPRGPDGCSRLRSRPFGAVGRHIRRDVRSRARRRPRARRYRGDSAPDSTDRCASRLR